MIIGSEILRFVKLTSTNSHAAMLIRNGEPEEGTVIQASYQTSGKGQAGDTWESEEGKNLLFSIILYPCSVMAEEQFFLSIAVSLGICDFLDSRITGSKIKWPNDIYIGNDKIAGILIENSLIGENIESSIAGIGLNLNQVSFPDHIFKPVSLKMITGVNYDPDSCLSDLLNAVDIRYKELLYGDRQKLRNEYTTRLYRLNEFHIYSKKGKKFKARIMGITGSGLLIVQKDDNCVGEYSFKEIDYVQ